MGRRALAACRPGAALCPQPLGAGGTGNFSVARDRVPPPGPILGLYAGSVAEGRPLIPTLQKRAVRLKKLRPERRTAR